MNTCLIGKVDHYLPVTCWTCVRLWVYNVNEYLIDWEGRPLPVTCWTCVRLWVYKVFGRFNFWEFSVGKLVCCELYIACACMKSLCSCSVLGMLVTVWDWGKLEIEMWNKNKNGKRVFKSAFCCCWVCHVWMHSVFTGAWVCQVWMHSIFTISCEVLEKIIQANTIR